MEKIGTEGCILDWVFGEDVAFYTKSGHYLIGSKTLKIDVIVDKYLSIYLSIYTN